MRDSLCVTARTTCPGLSRTEPPQCSPRYVSSSQVQQPTSFPLFRILRHFLPFASNIAGKWRDRNSGRNFLPYILLRNIDGGGK